MCTAEYVACRSSADDGYPKVGEEWAWWHEPEVPFMDVWGRLAA
jgi:hypothetical protein